MLLPLAAAPFRDRRPWLVLGLAAQLLGIVGLTFWPDRTAVLGWGCGSWARRHLFGDARDCDRSFRASGHCRQARCVTQGVGFIVAAFAPIVAGLLRDATGTFTGAWGMLAISICAMIVLTVVFSPRSYARAIGPSDAGAALLPVKD